MIAFHTARPDAPILNAFVATYWAADLAQNPDTELRDEFLKSQVPFWTWIEHPDRCREAAVALARIAVAPEAEALSPLQRVMLATWLREWEALRDEPVEDDVDPALLAALARQVLAALGPIRLPHDIGRQVAEALEGYANVPQDLPRYRELIPKSVWALLEARRNTPSSEAR